jgi:hypothetical protein
MAAADVASLVDARAQGERNSGIDAPPGAVLWVEVEHHSMASPARAVEHQPLLSRRRPHHDRVACRQLIRYVADGLSALIGLPPPPVTDAFYEAQFNPKYMSRSDPSRFLERSQ